MLLLLSQNLDIQEAFETAAEVNEDLRRREFRGSVCKRFKLVMD